MGSEDVIVAVEGTLVYCYLGTGLVPVDGENVKGGFLEPCIFPCTDVDSWRKGLAEIKEEVIDSCISVGESFEVETDTL